jgi:hypothetical protein
MSQDTTHDASARHGDGSDPATPHEVLADVQEQIRQAADEGPGRHDRDAGAMATPTQHEAEAVTAARTPSRAAEQALEERLEAEGADPSSNQGDGARQPTAKEIVDAEAQEETGEDEE